MTWHYQARQREKGSPYSYVDVTEVYTHPEGTTVDSITPIGDTKEDLISVLEMMLSDVKHYPVYIDKEAI